MFKKFGKLLVWCAVFAVVSLSLGFTIAERNRIVCTEVRVEITDSTKNQFLRSREIRSWVLSRYPNILKRNLDYIDLRAIEDGLRKIKAVEEVAVFTSIVGRGKPGEGSLVVRIWNTIRYSYLRIHDRNFLNADLGRH